MVGCLRNLILSFDIFSTKPNFMIHQKERYQTLYGGTLSFLSIGFSITIFIYFFIKLLSKTTYTVNSNISFSNQLNKNAPSEDYLLMFNVMDNNRIPYVNQDQIFKIYFTIFTYNKIYLNSSLEYNSVQRDLNVSRCTTERLSKFSDKLKSINIQNYYCVDPNQTIYFENTIDHPTHYSYFVIYFAYCTNTTQTTCLSQQEINMTLANYHGELITLENYVDNSNRLNPIQFYASPKYDSLSANSFVKIYKYYEQTIYSSDDGLVFNNSNFANAIGSNFQNVYSGNLITEATHVPYSFLGYYFQLKPTTLTIIRTYDKLQNLVSQIGGFISSVILVMEIIIFFISTNDMFLHIFFSQMKIFDLKFNKLPPLQKKQTAKDLGLVYENYKAESLSNLIVESERKLEVNDPKEALNIYDIENLIKRIELKITNEITNIKSEGFLLNILGINFCSIKKKKTAYFKFIQLKIEKYFDVLKFIKLHNTVKYMKKMFTTKERYLLENLSNIRIIKDVELRPQEFRNKNDGTVNSNLYQILTTFEQKFSH